MSMKQNDAVVKATLAVIKEHGLEWNGKSPVSKIFQNKSEYRSMVVEMVVSGIESGDVDFSESARAKYNTTEKVRSYVSGMVSNTYRKDKRMNGGEQYVPTNPGSRAGSTDPLIKNLKLAIKSGALTPDKVKIAEQEIEQRLSELRAEKSKVEIDLDSLPSELKAKLGL